LLLLLLLLLATPQTIAQTIGGNVYGGGEQGKVKGNSDVTIKSGKLGTFAMGGVTSGGNVYGGGNAGDLEGHTTVTLQGGNICGGVFGGAQQADVNKYTYVNIDGANQLHDLTVNRVYGGNDVSGVIGATRGGTAGAVDGLPFTPDVNISGVTVDNTWQSFIKATPEKSADLDIFIGQMFGGGNGDYGYTTGNAETNPYFGKTAPTVAKTYLQVNGGTYGYVFAGGNNATVTSNTVISINNTGKITTATDDLDLTRMTTLEQMMNPDFDAQANTVDHRLLSMGLNISTFHTGHHFNRVFGGNNKADMKIMPTWNLTAGNIHDLYSGGNEGRMISSQGILLEIKNTSEISAENVFGGCRKADVRPLTNSGADMDNSQIQLTNPTYHFPAGFAARVLVRGGDIRNVFGGNDISGKVYGGNAVGVYTSIKGDVYGGGNGSYAYTDNAALKDDIIWGDFYYDPTKEASSIASLNAQRPNAEQVSLRLRGTEAKKTIIGGSVYVGGNSATLASKQTNPLVELKIGSYVIADNVFLGNNGENMIDPVYLKRYASNVTNDAGQDGKDFSTLNLKETDTFNKYMEGCAMTLIPKVVFDGDASTDAETYQPYTSYFGSFFGGGNVGSMITKGTTTLDFDKEVVIYNKLVGGCNNANIAEGEYNTAYKGGILGTADERDSYTDGSGNIKDRLVLNLSGVKLEPMRWKVRKASIQPPTDTDITELGLATMDAKGVVTPATGKANDGVTYYEYINDTNGQHQLEYNVFSHGEGTPILEFNAESLGTNNTPTDVDTNRRLIGANVYGGCYNSGHVNGNVVINLNSTIHDRKKLFDETNAPADAKLYEYGGYNITTRHTGVLLGPQAMDVSVMSLGVFGGGYGESSEVWGSATVNLNKGFTFQIYAGGEQGIIGKSSNLTYNPQYSTFSNLNGKKEGDAATVSEDMAEAEFIYGGAFKGLVLGDTHVNLGNGRVFNSIGGSCAADIYGHSELYMGRGSNDDSQQGFPWVIDHVYGGNDVAGKIKNSADFTDRVREDARPKMYGYHAENTPKAQVTQASSYVEYQQGRVVNIFGGSCGDFDYKNDAYYKNFADNNEIPFVDNAFVNFTPLEDNSKNRVTAIFGGSQGHKDGDYKDKMQNRSYVLVDVPQNMTTFTTTEVFGGGENGGLGMAVPKATAEADETSLNAVSAVVDLVRGQISTAYGGSFSQGMTRRTIINVPAGSTSVVDNIFGGAFGEDPLKPCDVYQSIVNYNSSDARVNGAIYGGNNNADRTLYTQVNINAPVKQSNGYDGYVYGAGKGKDTWAQYTEVNLNEGSSVYEVYGGGDAGMVLNKESLLKWKENNEDLDLTLGGDYVDNYLDDPLAKTSALYSDLNGTYKTYKEKYNTNVIINKGAYVGNYAYGGGKGKDAVVSGSTYIALLGGTVNKDTYAAGTSGPVMDLFKSKDFTASATAYIRGGRTRNVYGGGWEGDVGYHDNNKTSTEDDILGETHVVIGRTVCGNGNLDFYDGKPTVRRNAYGGGEGGSVFGTANLTLYNGYIGYKYEDNTYKEHLNDRTASDGVGEGLLKEAGNLFGSGYADLSNADFTNVSLYGGVVRNSIYGGGEIGTVGRGKSNGSAIPTIYKGGAAHVDMFDGHVKRNAFGGGRGYDNLNRISAIGTSGYVFGSTEIHIHGGEIGTAEGVANGDGNVFGGGNIGFVYSANGTKHGTKGDGDKEGYYYDSNDQLTEDCSVIISPWTKVKPGQSITLNGHVYGECKYVQAEDLNFLKDKNTAASEWEKVEDKGVVIRNAVFAGGNVSTGSDQVSVNAKTVFGNATATIYDIYNRDLLTLGTENVGGLYGDGNLTFVDGYRELNITNYGTDYYGMSENISYEDYQKLTERERAYFELKYQCKTGYHSNALNKDITANEKITVEEYNALQPSEQGNWERAGICTIYAGRLLNTIQRADFCGIFGSRLVLQGAQDRVPSVVDYNKYTINRVGEVSLNKSNSQAGDEGARANHGCYFGIYNVVNHLGALTTDVDFKTAVRTTDNAESIYATNGMTFEEWKTAHLHDRTRNNGTSDHKVALASGVYLEITKEGGTKDNKIWGPITGVCQLDLIDVSTGLGGGYVYAQNIHGKRKSSGKTQTILSTYNKEGHGHGAGVTHKIWDYDDPVAGEDMETSGNFIHNVKQIVDDCFPVSHSYLGADASKAHYWYIKGQVYVYDQYISAYTGSATAYSETINLPLTITLASRGKLQLQDVQPNLYAYYEDTNKSQVIGTTPITVNGKDYSLNKPITYWEWSLLSAEDKKHFVAETYITTADCTLEDNTVIPKGTVYLPGSEFDALKEANPTVTATSLDATNPVPFDDVFHMTNNISHGNGYALTYNMNNPAKWDRYYSPAAGDSKTLKLTTSAFNELSEQEKAGYLGGPTYKPVEDGVYGQHKYAVGDIIPNAIHADYEALGTNKPVEEQAEVAEAYVATGEVVYTIGGTEHHVYKGSSIPATDFNLLTAEQKTKFATANICSSTIELGNDEFIFYGDLLTDAEVATHKATYKAKLIGDGMTDSEAETKTNADFEAKVSKAWYCTEAGKYGGNYFEESKNYRALDAWCSMSETDRSKFKFNYDAFDVLIDPNYGGPERYDGYDASDNRIYSPETAVDYMATYNGTENLTYNDENSEAHTIEPNDELTGDAYEDIPNEKRYYKSFTVTENGMYYIVKEDFNVGDVRYTAGSVITETIYNSLDANQKSNVLQKELSKDETQSYATYHFCYEGYSVNEKGEGVAVKDIDGTTHNESVPKGTILSDEEYAKLPNKQTNFIVHGTIPVETSTLYVPRQSNINDLSEDKVITVIYEYTYEESDASGNNIEQISEQHVVNIHIQFKTGVPEIGELQKPSVVLPSNTVGLKQPNVTPGAFEIIGGGWEMFTNPADAEQHTNGIPYENNLTPMYWYQDGYYVAYYAKSYLGKTYSNSVQFSVANYHDLDDVMKDKEHHMYVDNPHVQRNSKIYIDDRECESDASKNELDLLKDFYDLSLRTSIATEGALKDHALLDSHVKQAGNLDFILRSNMEPKAYTDWSSIGNEGACFSGTLHGDGYTINGLSSSLFNYLCGSVYNLGVTGSFSGAGVAEEGDGYVENCWISTTGTPDGNAYAVFGNPANTSAKQIVNCYYPSTKNYKTEASSHGMATAKSEEAFYNGEVAYDLNGFYLYKRYCDQEVTSGVEYKNYTVGADNTLTLSDTKHYAQNETYCSSGYNNLKYVEDRFGNSDFIYAGGEIPEGVNERYSSESATYYPIWPHDYIFFGQKLTYGYADNQQHQPLPSHIIKSGDRILMSKGNRVYRAPAYYQNSVMKTAHFNPDAYLAQLSKDGTRTAYPHMTAIDFTGHNDVKNGYQLGPQTAGFYTPLLDDDGLNSIVNIDETKNLLVYIPQATATATDAVTKTNAVVTEYLPDATYSETNNTTYRTVAKNTATINGHRIVKDNAGYDEGSYTAPVDHLLVDKQDFNAPIAYNFAEGKRMWYQRTPDTYADMTKGWEGISIPFEAELVTTQQKGELTHFYTGSTKGHEYWLRQFASGGRVDADNEQVFKANFAYPAAGCNHKEYTNTFLWDYYYSQNPEAANMAGQDENTDEYQKADNARKYYSEKRTYEDYPFNGKGTPYIIGFPGKTYYEFDLSGQFVPQNTYAAISKLNQQVITFASKPKISIAVSDTELADSKVTNDNYTFMPNYLSSSIAAGTFMMKADGSSYKKTTDATAAVPFRPYFTSTAGARRNDMIDEITFSSISGIEELDPTSENSNGKLNIYAEHEKIIVESSCRRTRTVQIQNISGITVRSFTIKSGETIETPIHATGVYIVNGKKLRVSGR